MNLLFIVFFCIFSDFISCQSVNDVNLRSSADETHRLVQSSKPVTKLLQNIVSTSSEEETKLMESIEKLMQSDAEIVDHLRKMALELEAEEMEPREIMSPSPLPPKRIKVCEEIVDGEYNGCKFAVMHEEGIYLITFNLDEDWTAKDFSYF